MFPRIRATILKIPRGKVSTYGAIARAAGYPGAARQVVWALRGAQGLPWHRVVAAGGRIALPGESGMEQRFRLEAEGVYFSGSRVRMAECEFKFVKKAQPHQQKIKNNRPSGRSAASSGTASFGIKPRSKARQHLSRKGTKRAQKKPGQTSGVLKGNLRDNRAN